MKPTKLCIECKKPIPPLEVKKPPARCPDCQKPWKAEASRRQRKAKKQYVLDNDNIPDRRVCSVCYTLKRFSEFTTNRKDGSGRLNKVCDSCLTRLYSGANRVKDGLGPNFWRQRAYACNTSYRAIMAVQRGVKRSEIRLADLPRVCKPQDLARLFEAQQGLCHYCRVDLTEKNLAVDHAQPRSKGGSHEPENFRLACQDCNRLKWDMSEVEFRLFLVDYLKRFQVSDLMDKEP